MSQTTLVTPRQVPTDETIAKINGLVGTFIRTVRMSEAGLREVIKNPEGFERGLKRILRRYELKLKEQRNPYFRERVKPNPDWSYDPSTLPAVDAQVTNAFTVMGLLKVKSELIDCRVVLPKKADGLLVVPSLTDLGRHLKVADPLGTGYGPLTELAVERLGISRLPNFHNYRKGSLTEKHVRLEARVIERWQALETKFPNQDPQVLRLFVLPVNSGSAYHGWSSRNSRNEAVLRRRLPFGPAEVAWMLAAWPERLVRDHDTRIDCSGCEYAPRAGDDWGLVLYWLVRGGVLEFDRCWARSPYGGFGTAVAFPPE